MESKLKWVGVQLISVGNFVDDDWWKSKTVCCYRNGCIQQKELILMVVLFIWDAVFFNIEMSVLGKPLFATKVIKMQERE